MADRSDPKAVDEAATQQGSKLVFQRRYKEAVELLQPLRKRIRNGKFNGHAAVVLQSLGIAYVELSRAQDARDCFEQGLAAARRDSDGSMEGACLHELALMALKAMDAGRAFELARDAAVALACAGLCRFSSKRDAVRREPLDALNLISISLLSLGALDEAERVLMILKECHEARNDLPWLSTDLHKLGMLQFQRGQAALGRMYFGQALQIAKVCGDVAQIERCFRQLQMCEERAQKTR